MPRPSSSGSSSPRARHPGYPDADGIVAVGPEPASPLNTFADRRAVHARRHGVAPHSAPDGRPIAQSGATARADCEPGPAVGCPEPPTHVVVAGDTLWGIARRYGTSVEVLLAANPQITDRRLIRVGDVISLSLIDLEALAPRSLVDLGAPLGGPARAIKVNDCGQVLVMGWTPSASYTRAFVWQDGVMTDLGTLGGPATVVWDINNRGQVVGSSLTPSMAGHAFIWQDGVMTDLGSPGPHGGDALDINDRGQVVGEFVTASAHAVRSSGRTAS